MVICNTALQLAVLNCLWSLSKAFQTRNKMASSSKRPCRVYTAEEVANICMINDNEDESDIDSETGGISSGEEEELDEELQGISEAEFKLR